MKALPKTRYVTVAGETWGLIRGGLSVGPVGADGGGAVRGVGDGPAQTCGEGGLDQTGLRRAAGVGADAAAVRTRARRPH